MKKKELKSVVKTEEILPLKLFNHFFFGKKMATLVLPCTQDTHEI